MSSPAPLSHTVVFMGVAGCGKSSLAAAVAQAEGLPLVEGDDFHSEASRSKMSRGVPLTDADREGWLDTLAGQIAAAPGGLLLTCSALKRAYPRPAARCRCRAALRVPGFARDAALARVAARSEHFFSATLVDNQFATLEPPTGEPGVLRVDALAPLAQLQQQ